MRKTVTKKVHNDTQSKHRKSLHLSVEDIYQLLSNVKPIVTTVYEEGLYIITCEDIRMYGEGKTIEEAIDSLMNLLQDYIEDFISNYKSSTYQYEPNELLVSLKLASMDYQNHAMLKQELGL